MSRTEQRQRSRMGPRSCGELESRRTPRERAQPATGTASYLSLRTRAVRAAQSGYWRVFTIWTSV